MLSLKQIVSQIRSEDWFVTIDLKDVYFHISILLQHRKFLRFASGAEAYQYCVLPFGLASRVKLDQLLTVKRFQRLLVLMAAASNVIPCGLLYMRLLQWWLRTKGFSPRGNPLHTIRVRRRYLRALVVWKEPWFRS